MNPRAHAHAHAHARGARRATEGRGRALHVHANDGSCKRIDGTRGAQYRQSHSAPTPKHRQSTARSRDLQRLYIERCSAFGHAGARGLAWTQELFRRGILALS
eukprot:5721542-Pleurochrysis_carterae.AAC.2